ncbi:hypothetical protein [Maritalea myrionectae]|uniref:hypothetical protein n=1 Tax=Maritalea myrionectae TaxID=454601 RepID=UPI000569C09B|nr:hypothetical protein [Maritalea myrionectae]
MATSKNILLSAFLIVLLAAIDWGILSQIIASIINVFGTSRGVGFGITLHYTHQLFAAITALGLLISTFRHVKIALIAMLVGHGAVMIYLWPSTDAKKFMAVVVSSYILSFLMLKLLNKARSYLRLT